MEPFLEAVLAGGLTGEVALFIAGVLLALLAVAAVPLHVLTWKGSATAFLFGVFFLLVGGYPYLLLMVLFVALGGIATRYRLAEKRWRKVAEGIEGERRAGNVLAHTIPGAAILLVALLPVWNPDATFVAFVYTAALAFGAADTYASEIGVLSPRPVNILGGGEVPPGTDGGITLLGEVAAFAGGFFLVLLGGIGFQFFEGVPGLKFLSWVLLATLAGWVGCQLDSVLGATLERHDILGKNGVNMLAMFGTLALAFAIWSVV